MSLVQKAGYVLRCLCFLLFANLVASSYLSAQQEDEEEPFRPGLIATYADEAGVSVRRLDEAIAFDWQEGTTDSRISSGPFNAKWTGKLFAQGEGQYRLHVFATGEVEVKLAGQTVIARQTIHEGWLSSEPRMLSFEHHPLEVSFRKTEKAARVALYWSGPQFQLEPIPPRSLFHDRTEVVDLSFERGEVLARALRCAACHQGDDATKSSPAPSLANLAGNADAAWLVAWLKEAGDHNNSKSRRRMPAFGLVDDEARAITAYLLQSSEPAGQARRFIDEAPSQKNGKVQSSSTKKGDKPPEPPSPAQGERLLLTLGCLACHQVGELGESGLFGGGDLSAVACKRPAAFFEAWLTDPAKLNPDHRMPVFDLTADERKSLAQYLATLKGKAGVTQGSAADTKSANKDLVAKGRELVARYRCAACHKLAGDLEPTTQELPKPLAAASDWNKSCSREIETSKSRLGYSLAEPDRKALQEYFTAKRRSDFAVPATSKRRLALLEQNCLACHQREGLESLAPVLPSKLADKLAGVAEKHDELATLIPAMTPPSLNSVGDKLHETALADTIRRKGEPLRNYLLVRMPKFRVDDAELKGLVDYFVSSDRIPARNPREASKPDPATVAGWNVVSGRLVSTDGFACISCHQVGKVVPDKAPVNARGPKISGMDQRIRKEWFDRFIRNPARIVPRMEMPSVQIPIRGVLQDKLDDQLAALWHILNTPGFKPPEPNSFRVLRASGTSPHEGAIVVTDVVKSGDEMLPHSVLIGLPNRHNVLFDLESNRLASWWSGDAARQYTKGKSWFWEPGGRPLLTSPNENELSVIVEGKALSIEKSVEGLARLEGVDRDATTVKTRYRVELRSPDNEKWHGTVAQYVSAATDLPSPRSGIWRHLFFSDFPAGEAIVLRLLDPETAGRSKIDERRAFHLPTGERIELWLPPKSPPAGITFRKDGTLRIPLQRDLRMPGFSQPADVVLVYSTEAPVDSHLEDSSPQPLSEDAALEIGAGFMAVRERLPLHLMPTGFSWRSDGLLLACTLSGQVYIIDDRATRSSKPRFAVIADGLAAPYGIDADQDMVTETSAAGMRVATKIGVVGIGYGPEQSVLTNGIEASGWGMTDDYHDWSACLVRSETGEYFIGLPCQQDERSELAATLRGSVIKLTRRRPTKENPQRYSIEAVSTGHRFPMGLAVNREGDLFVTDNQGNYNPFNELNHVRKGAFFGFVNAIDKKNKDYVPPPVTQPAINIPHPWTRSVNGICFLYTPKKLREETGKDAFGPLEGHLVGCEYDTRRLIRMTLQKIGDTYQGAAYPLSKEPSSPEKGFLGPIVCAVSPRGELYVGSIRESGWGAGNNVGEIVKIKVESEKLPCGIAEVKAVKDGFTIDFFREVDARKAADIANYSLTSYRRISTPAYGGPDVGRRTEKITKAEVSADRRQVTLHLPELRTGFVYDFQLKNLALEGKEFFPAEAYFTLHGVP